jgi:TetR/AcrR family transcriptional regulator, cholesterol catabolism regulator
MVTSYRRPRLAVDLKDDLGDVQPPKKASAKANTSKTVKSKNSRRRKAALLEGGAEYRARREELIRVAANLFKDRGYNKTTFNDIAEYTGVERATLYYYFGSKQELFQEACKGAFDRNLSDIEVITSIGSISASEKLGMLMERLMVYFDEAYPYLYIYLQEHIHNVAADNDPWAQEMIASTRRFEAAYLALITEGIEKGEFRSDVPPVLAANAVFGMLNWTHKWYKPNSKYDSKTIATAFRSIFFDGMKKHGI